MEISELKLVVDAQALLGEGPCWDATGHCLFWVDILGHRLHCYDPIRQLNRSIDVGQQVSAVALREKGGVILALRNGLYALDTETEELTPLCQPDSSSPHIRFNDGKCSPEGLFWVGMMSERDLPEGALYVLNTDLSLRRAFGGVSCSNGIAWSQDGRKMYYIDTLTRQVVAFDYEIGSGVLGRKDVVIIIPANEGFPDGMTIDDEGMLWVAHWNGGQVSRWNPATGERLDTVVVPASKVTSCAFGGEELDILYITTARTDLSENELALQPLAGGLFALKTGVKGRAPFSFRG